MTLSVALALWLAPSSSVSPGSFPLPGGPPRRWGPAAVELRAQADRSRRFPLRREGGGTRGACASRLVAHLVPTDGVLDPGSRPILGVIEGESPQPAPLVLRWPGGERIEPARRGAAVRLLLLDRPPGPGTWETFPACEGSAEPQAPPARSRLDPASAAATPAAAAPARDAQAALRELWRQCGRRVATAALLARWDYAHLADRLPSTLPVLCTTALPPDG